MGGHMMPEDRLGEAKKQVRLAKADVPDEFGMDVDFEEVLTRLDYVSRKLTYRRETADDAEVVE